MPAVSALRAAGGTHPGLHRDVNEDRIHVDPERGLFMVIDGIGGQAAGGRAADLALEDLRRRLESRAGSVPDRLRDAIATANNDICRAADSRPEWRGMACVLTVVVVEEGCAVVGHVGDTRLYMLTSGGLRKLTHDHSPVGEREDAGDLSELEAMHHPRRNEVYRDVGSDLHQATDPDFIEIIECPFEPDAALVLCSDGLTDLVDSSAVERIVRQSAGDPEEVVNRLIEAANGAGGKDNVSVVYVEGDAVAHRRVGNPSAEITRRLGSLDSSADHISKNVVAPAAPLTDGTRRPSRRNIRLAFIVMMGMLAFLIASSIVEWPSGSAGTARSATAGNSLLANVIRVAPGESIAAALARATPGTDVMVEPGEYREAVQLPAGVRLISQERRGAVIRLPATAAETGAAVVASKVRGAALVGFRVLGDAATPLGTGLLVEDSDVSVTDVDVSGAAGAAAVVTGTSMLHIAASDIHDNSGAAVVVRTNAHARLTHNSFARNGSPDRAPSPFVVDPAGNATFVDNVFRALDPAGLPFLDDAARAANVWLDIPRPRPAMAGASRGRR